jgi:hypothetical protein
MCHRTMVAFRNKRHNARVEKDTPRKLVNPYLVVFLIHKYKAGAFRGMAIVTRSKFGVHGCMQEDIRLVKAWLGWFRSRAWFSLFI